MDSGRFDRDLKADLQESLGGGHYGWLDDGLATVAPWGFDLASIETPVLLLQGGQDLMVPAAHAYGMAEVLPNATLEYLPEEGHMTLGMEPGRALDWLLPFATDLDHDTLAAMTTMIPFDRVIKAGRDILDGKVRGRVVVEIG